jgi:hypothetical protein
MAVVSCSSGGLCRTTIKILTDTFRYLQCSYCAFADLMTLQISCRKNVTRHVPVNARPKSD